MRRAAKTDANHGLVVSALEACGATVQSLAQVGRGCPDILVGHRGKNYIFEIKHGDKSPSRRKLTDDQVIWHRDWRGQVAVVETVEQAISALAKLASRAS